MQNANANMESEKNANATTKNANATQFTSGLVSVVTPCYNGESFLDRYFEGILAQTYRPIEVILVDDGSTDATYSLTLSYKEKLEAQGIRLYMADQGGHRSGPRCRLHHPCGVECDRKAC